MIIALAAMMLTATAPGPTPEQSQAWTEAEANRPNMKAQPRFLEGPKAQLPESEKAQGHHGPVVIQGIIGIDGKMKELRVRISSGVPTLDAIALNSARASTFTPAKDANGAHIPVVISMPFDLVAYKSAGGGLFQYRCGQFARDMDWWRSANPEKALKEHELYKMELGFEMLFLIQRSKGDRELLNKRIATFDDRWKAAIETCRKKPDMLQRDVIYQ